eukprot:TRINITY_DN11008_c0_g1_i1.p1 TRINITY_DN11008_c0_g1~~TRINITY_DN11008_c0_g1_i1.p1  ORF type:complete len:480 (+),score=57.52 TRINITY_DN11008_c0_g1_i1:71-1441(+)
MRWGKSLILCVVFCGVFCLIKAEEEGGIKDELNGNYKHLLPWEKVEAYHLPNISSPGTFQGTHLGNAQDFDQLMRAYSELHAKILNGTKPKRYLLYDAWQEVGFGNRMQGIISAFVAAMVSERALIINWKEQHRVPVKHVNPGVEFISMPAHDTIFDNPYNIQWTMSEQQRAELAELDSDRKRKLASRKDGKKLDSYILCTASVQLDGRPWIITSTWDYLCPVLLLNPWNTHIKNVIDKYVNELTTHDDRPFELTMSFLLGNYGQILRPKAEVRKRIQELRDKLFPKNKQILGVHLRTTHPSISFKEDSVTKIAQCILLSKTRAVFVAADSLDYKIQLQKKLEQLAPNIIQFISLDTKSVDRQDIDSSADAINEIYLLSATDKILIQGGSTFGRVASAIGGIKEPLVFRENTCVRKMSSELCYYNYHKIKGQTCFKEYGRQQTATLYSDYRLCWTL